MFLIVIFALTISACVADLTIAPPPPILCGDIPSKMVKCIGNPKIIQARPRDCASTNPCEALTCVFTKAGWLKDGRVKKEKVISHFNEFARDHPVWSAAVEHVKTTCLTRDLPPQGIFVNCPAYDIFTCAVASFIKNAPETQWSQSQDCQYPKQFAAVCPYCPNECFATMIPIGSCNACYGLPRSP